MLKRYLPQRPSRAKVCLIVGAMLFIYLLDNLPVKALIGSDIFSNVLKPVLWLGLAFTVWTFPRIRARASLRHRESILWWAFILAVVLIVAQVCAGLLLDGFGKSPYSHSFKGILLNVLVIGSVLVGREAARGYMVNSLAREEKFLVFIPIALLMTAFGYPVSKFTSLKSLEETVKYLAQYFVPDFCQNLLATYLAFLGGWIPSLIYMGVLQAFHWLSPILPNLKWITAALVGIMCPVFSLTAMQNIYLKETRTLKKLESKQESPLSWMVTSILSIGIIWFAVGVFPVYPSVVATGSMEPMIMPGDMILVDKVEKMGDIDRLKAGDVIQFKRENILISHRIVEVIEREKAKSFRTKGDNNNVEDRELVKPGDVKGRIIQVVPKIGWPTLLIKKKDEVPGGVVF